MKKFLGFLICVSLFLVGFSYAASGPATTVADNISVKEARIVEVAKNKDVAEIYMDIINKSNKACELIAVTSHAAKRVVLHESVHHNGSVNMAQVKSIQIKSHTEKDLIGSLHIMLIGLNETLDPGELIPLTLVFSDGSQFTLFAMVTKHA